MFIKQTLFIYTLVAVMSCSSKSKSSDGDIPTPSSSIQAAPKVTTEKVDDNSQIVIELMVNIIGQGIFQVDSSENSSSEIVAFDITLDGDFESDDFVVSYLKTYDENDNELLYYFDSDDFLSQDTDGKKVLTFALPPNLTSRNIDILVVKSDDEIEPVSGYQRPDFLGDKVRKPSDITSTVDGGDVQISWQAPNPDDSLTPEIYIVNCAVSPATPAACDVSQNQTTTETNHSFTPEAGDTSWNCFVCSQNGDRISSETYILASTLAASEEPSISSFSGVSHVSDDDKVTLSFDLEGDETASYEVRKTTGATPPSDCDDGVLAASLSFDDTQFNDTVTPGQFYSYRLCSKNSENQVTGQETVSSIKSSAGIIFTSKTSVDGNMGGLTGADALCNSWASASNLLKGGTWKALLSSSTENALTRITGTGSIYNTNGEKVANSFAALWNADTVPLLSEPDYDEDGNFAANNVHTSTNAAGMDDGTNCLNWTSNNGLETVAFGDNSNLDETWLIATSGTCDEDTAIYCVSQ